MADPQTRIYALIAQTEQDRIGHRNNGRQIEAAACTIRLNALNDALAAFSPNPAEDKAHGR